MEFRNIIVYIYLSARHLFKGRFAEASANFRGAVIRIVELFRDSILKKKVKCDYCGWEGHKYKTFVATVHLRPNAVCPYCLSLERHREFLKMFRIIDSFFDEQSIKILDIAPTKAFGDYCKKNERYKYLSVDLSSQFAMEHMDLQDLKLQDESFDLVICYHVLDYLPDDVKGMKEIFRVLKKNGVAITQEGVDKNLLETDHFEKPLPENHYRLRQYGKDFYKKWGSVGFKYFLICPDEYSSDTVISAKDITVYDKLKEVLLGNNFFTEMKY